MTCPVCGTPTVAGARFCYACGTALDAAGAPEVETDRRVVTVLFGDLSDFTSWAEDVDPERVGVVTDRVLATLSAIVLQHGGRVDKLTGDGIMAVFGAPTSHEDDCERAVRAAAAMQSVVRRLVEQESGGGRRLGLRVGLNTGEVVAGMQAALSYTVIGDTVNTASRLSDAAGVGHVLAGRATALATLNAASWRALPPLRLKGKREPVAAYELVALRAAAADRLGLGDEAPFLGREAELGQLIGRLLDVVERSAVRAVVVTGEAGVGKTRLARELARFAGELPRARVLWGRCPPYGAGRDLTAVVEMVRTACGVSEQDDATAARQRVLRTVARLSQPTVAPPIAAHPIAAHPIAAHPIAAHPIAAHPIAAHPIAAHPIGAPAIGAPAIAAGAGERAPLPPSIGEDLQALLGLEDTGTGTWETASPGTAFGGDRVRAAVAALFTALAREGPLVLVLDDLHWASTSMLTGLLDVADRTDGPVLLLAVGRPEMVTRPVVPRWWEHLQHAEVLPLSPLEDSAAERLLSAYLGAPADPKVRDTLLARAQGNPFYLAELLQLLIDRGILRREQDRWAVVGTLPDRLLPAGVQAVLSARIDELDGSAKGVLRDASVLGTKITPAGLEAVGRASGHGDADVVRDAVATLDERRLLEVEGSGYRFAHTLVRDVAYAGLAKAERARRHAAAASWVSDGPPGGDADIAAASQGERAVRLAQEMGLPPGDPAWAAREVAVRAQHRLGRAALARADVRAADAVLSRALELAELPGRPPLPDAVVLPLRVAYAQALTALHILDRAEAQLQLPLAAADDNVRAGALVVLGEVRRRRGDLTGAGEALVTGFGAASRAGNDRLASEALRQLGLIDYFGGRLQAAQRRFRDAHALAVRVGDSRGAGWALQQVAWTATSRGDYPLADQTLAEAREVFTELGDSGGLAWVAGTEGFVRLLQGRLAEARALARSSLPRSEGAGERWGVAALLTIDAFAAAELGDIATAREDAERARSRFATLGDAWGQSFALTAAGVAARGDDDPARAVQLLTSAVGLSPDPLTTSLALVSLGYACLDRGDLLGADDAGKRAADLLSGLDLEPHAALGAKVLLAQVLRRRGELDAALSTLDAALDVSTATALLFPRRQALAHRAGTLLDLGRIDEALAAAEEALAMPGEDVRSRVMALRAYGAALHAHGDHARARLALTEALEVSRSTGQRAEIAASERALAAVRPADTQLDLMDAPAASRS